MRLALRGALVLMLGVLLGCDPDRTCPADADPEVYWYLQPHRGNPPDFGPPYSTLPVPYEGCFRLCDPAQPLCDPGETCEHRWHEDAGGGLGLWICLVPE